MKVDGVMAHYIDMNYENEEWVLTYAVCWSIHANALQVQFLQIARAILSAFR